jgi:hypothetical protein
MRHLTALFGTTALLAAVACGGGDQSASPVGPTPIGTGGTSPQATCSLPAAPSNLRLVSVSGTRVEFAWSASATAAEYVMLIGTTPSSSNILLTNTTQTTYSLGGAPAGHQYARVQAKNACGTSGSSNEVEYTVT